MVDDGTFIWKEEGDRAGEAEDAKAAKAAKTLSAGAKPGGEDAKPGAETGAKDATTLSEDSGPDDSSSDSSSLIQLIHELLFPPQPRFHFANSAVCGELVL